MGECNQNIFEKNNPLNIFDMYDKKREYLCINTITTCFHFHSMDF